MSTTEAPVQMAWEIDLEADRQSLDFMTESQLVSIFLIPDTACPEPSAAFVQSVKRFGVMTPIILAASGSGFRVLAGRRRLRAARLADLTAIPAVVIPETKIAGAMITVIENEQRTANAIAEYESIKSMLAFGMREEDIARETGMAPATIKHRIRLGSKLNEALYSALARGIIAASVAERASKLPAAAQDRLALRLAERGKLTAADVKEERLAIRQASAATLPRALWATGGEVEYSPSERREIASEAAARAMRSIEEGNAEQAKAAIAELLDLAIEGSEAE